MDSSSSVGSGRKVCSALDAQDLRAVLAALPDAVMVHRAGRILFINPAFTELTGHTAETVIGTDILHLIHPDDRPGAQERIDRFGESPPAEPGRPLRFLRRDETILHFELSPTVPVQLTTGPAALVVARDRTAHVSLQEQMQAMLPYECMGRIVGSVARAISDPLTYVLGNLTVLAASVTEETHSELLSSLADARSGAEQVRYLLSDLKAMTHPDDGEVGPVPLRHLVDSSANIARGTLAVGARLEKNLLPVPWVRGAETRLRLVLVKLMLESGACASRHNKDGSVRVTARTDEAGRAVCEVFDDGEPYGPELIESWGHAWYQADARGIGLGLCRTIIVEHGGSFEIHPRGAPGPRFVVALPALPFAPPTPARVRNVRTASRVRRGRILVVDDDLVIGALLRRALEGQDVYIMTSPHDAIELCRDLAFDVVLVDLVMPDLDGTDLYRALCELQPRLKDRVLFITAGPITGETSAFLKRIPNPVFEKPFDFAAVRSCVESFLVVD